MKTEYIDITPTWASIAPMLCHTIEFGTPQGAQACTEEIIRMAGLADRYNHMVKRMGEDAAREYLSTYGNPSEAGAGQTGEQA